MTQDQIAVVTGVFTRSAEVKQRFVAESAREIVAAAAKITESLREGHKILFAGNGGSAADSQHLATEFSGRFMRERRGLPGIALTTDTSALTAIGNDYGYDEVFRRQTEAIGRPGDVLVLITTSGKSANLLKAAEYARANGIYTIGFLGRDGGPLASLVDLPLIVRDTDGQRIQECHITLGHAICLLVEDALFA